MGFQGLLRAFNEFSRILMAFQVKLWVFRYFEGLNFKTFSGGVKSILSIFRDSNEFYRDGILRERREHARGRNLADCGRICGSPRKYFGSIEEMWKKYFKGLTMWIILWKKH